MKSIQVGGIDWSTDKNKTALVTIKHDIDGLQVLETRSPLTGHEVCKICKSEHLDAIAVDTPFGWPEKFTRFINDWSPGGSHLQFHIPDSLDFRLRITDQVVKDELDKMPLSVSADKIGSAAHAWVDVVSRGGFKGQFELGIKEPLEYPSIIEVYPAATRKALTLEYGHGRFDQNLKDEKAREKIITNLAYYFAIEISDEMKKAIISTGKKDHCVDALVAAITCLMYKGLIKNWEVRYPKSQIELQGAEHEGWIFFPVRM